MTEPVAYVEPSVERSVGPRGRLSPLRMVLFMALAVGYVAFHIYVVLSQSPPPLERRAIHVGIGFALLFIRMPTRMPRWVPDSRPARGLSLLLDTAMVLLALASCWYLVQEAPGLPSRAGIAYDADVIFGIALIVITLEATRRVLGMGLPILALAALLYAVYGYVIPGNWGHGGYSPERLTNNLYLGLEGLFGIPTGASVDYIFVFLLFAALLGRIGATEALSDLATGLFGRVRGGSGKVAVVASGSFGMVTGSAVANVASVGTFTIPTMIRSGIAPRMAASVEAVSSVGSQVVPPVMGASAFVMAEFLAVPYSTVALAAILPAILYYLAAYFMVDFYSAKRSIGGISKQAARTALKGLSRRIYLLLPLFAMIYLVTVAKVNPGRSALYALAICVLIGLLRSAVRRAPVKVLLDAIAATVDVALAVVAAVVAAGIIVGVLTLTGLGNKMSSGLVDLAGGNLFVLLLLTMFVAIILGAGLPTVPTYVVLVVILSPALQELGVPAIAAHFFVLYFGVLADLTPPTAVSVVVAAGIAKVNPWPTMFSATRVGLFGYLIPFLFVYYPELLLAAEAPDLQRSVALGGALVAVVATAGALEGWLGATLGPLSRVVLAAAVVPVFLQEWWGSVGAALVVMAVWLVARGRRPAVPTGASSATPRGGSTDAVASGPVFPPAVRSAGLFGQRYPSAIGPDPVRSIAEER